MIKNPKHKGFVQESLENAKRALTKFLKQETQDEDPFYSLQIALLEGRITDLEAEITEYEQLTSGELTWLEDYTIEQISEILIKTRLARNWSQKDLGEKLGIDEQQIQRYEYKDYEPAKLSRVLEIIYSMGLKLEFKPIYIGTPVENKSDDDPFDLDEASNPEIEHIQQELQLGDRKINPIANR